MRELTKLDIYGMVLVIVLAGLAGLGGCVPATVKPPVTEISIASQSK